jgi:hypothetical protein
MDHRRQHNYLVGESHFPFSSCDTIERSWAPFIGGAINLMDGCPIYAFYANSQ